MSTVRYRLLVTLVVAEVLTLAVLLLNLGAIHDPLVARITGPVHGALYLVVALVALLTPGLRWRTRLLGLVPVVGGIAAARGLRARSAPGADGREGG